MCKSNEQILRLAELITKAEEKVMRILWSLKRGLIRDVVSNYEDPKPAYTTVATIIKILEKKGFIGRKPIANTHEYYPLIEQSEYSRGMVKSLVRKYFSNSYKRMVSALTNDEQLSTEELEELITHLQENLEQKKKK